MSNVLSFVGNLGRDAEVRYTPSGTAVLSLNVAMSSGYGDKKKTDWVRVSMFGKVAESSLKDYLIKGTSVFVSGELSLDEYKAIDGTNKTALRLVANVINLVGRKGDGANNATTAQTQNQHNAEKSNGYAPSDKEPKIDNFGSPYDDEIPF